IYTKYFILSCSKQGGMRRSHQTNTLVLFSDQTGSNVYKDKWLNGILQYTGMGLKGDQVLDKNQNKVLANSKSNFVKIHLFETFKPKEHTYLGEVYLAGQIYTVNEKDSSGNSRKVYKFPLALINQEQLIEDKDIYNQEENQTRHIRNLSDAKLEEEARKVSNYNMICQIKL
ncbi:restriction endonuclease, partial [Enterococcus faecium]